jgi:hypothetical protein
MLEEGPDSFEGGTNARKYVAITKTAKATGQRSMPAIPLCLIHKGNRGFHEMSHDLLDSQPKLLHTLVS